MSPVKDNVTLPAALLVALPDRSAQRAPRGGGDGVKLWRYWCQTRVPRLGVWLGRGRPVDLVSSCGRSTEPASSPSPVFLPRVRDLGVGAELTELPVPCPSLAGRTTHPRECAGQPHPDPAPSRP